MKIDMKEITVFTLMMLTIFAVIIVLNMGG
jgi:hypothetical protein